MAGPVYETVEEVGTMAPNVMPVTREELLARRDALLSRVGLTREALAERANTYSLSGDEFETLTEIEEIEFLLGE
jgi:hypothetical protein